MNLSPASIARRNLFQETVELVDLLIVFHKPVAVPFAYDLYSPEDSTAGRSYELEVAKRNRLAGSAFGSWIGYPLLVEDGKRVGRGYRVRSTAPRVTKSGIVVAERRSPAVDVTRVACGLFTPAPHVSV